MTDLSSYFSEYLRHRWIKNIQKVEYDSSTGIDGWLAEGAYTWLDAGVGGAVLQTSLSSNTLAEAFASEIARFACATFESLLDTEAAPHSPSALSWGLIRYYYASFYAAHALLRVSGKALTMISQKTANIMNSVGGCYLGVSPNISPALYLVSSDRHTPEQLRLTKVGGRGGSHEEMWQHFLTLLRAAENEILVKYSGSTAASEALEELKDLQTNLCHDGKVNGAWLSMVRNNLNYRHDYGVWFPFGGKKKFAQSLSARMLEWKPSAVRTRVAKGEHQLGSFVTACNVTVGLLNGALADISMRSPKPNASFVSRYPYRLLKLRMIKIP
ncbi:MAG: hypothetical protein K2Y28_06475 [Burkholderiaceae bacterium]|nr:hypothetical protein [Burkholderiaceae bacterium]